MDHATPSTKIKEPREKLNATPEDVYSLLGYSWGERRQIITVVQKVYQRHNIAQHDMGYRKIDKDLIDRAKSDLLKELPHLFKKCDSDWFADWALSRRHKTRNTKKTKKTDSPNTEQPISDDEAVPETGLGPSMETQPSGAGESSSKSSEARVSSSFRPW
ncbi:hypothetical protein Q9L58_004675 [Maublancomyces gigas]|uniref:Uncharacterized protein n=1 Tax=Discina gigas TaxID=1032678 RepID=A0ABR3GK60_9PEZI